MNIESEPLESGIVKISLHGRMDVEGAQEIDLKLNGYTATQRAVIVDKSEVSFLASMGIRSLLLVAKAVSGRSGKLVLLSPDASVTRILMTAGVDTLIPICRSIENACTAVSR